MKVQRCPECGIRLTTNYCDICMKRVPFTGVPAKQTFQHMEGSSAHKMEKGHACISFADEKKPKKTTFIKPVKKYAPPKKKGAAAVAIALAAVSLLSAVFGIIEESVDSEPVPEPEYYSAEGFAEAGEPGAEGVPNVLTGEIYNANGIRITADYAGLSYGEYTAYFTVYNDTNKKVTVSFENISVNGWMLSYGAYQEVKAGKSESISITCYSDDLEKAGIEQVSEVAFDLYAYESDDYEDIVVGELVRVQTEASAEAEQMVEPAGLELYNDGSVRIILTEVNLPGYDDCELELYAQNLSGSSVSIYNDGVWVNGQLASSYYWKVLRPDTRAFDNVYIYELEALNIQELSDLEEITIDFYVEYMDGLDILERISESVTFEPGAIG